jgi:cytochrome c551/c552
MVERPVSGYFQIGMTVYFRIIVACITIQHAALALNALNISLIRKACVVCAQRKLKTVGDADHYWSWDGVAAEARS